MLQGMLSDFSLPDVFSLLALTKKTGSLRVSSGSREGRVLFREGAICLALSDANRVPLLARLVSAGLVEAEQLREIVAEHTGSSIAVTDALLRSGHVEDRVLSVFMREQIIDAVFELTRLEEGSFSFDVDEPALTRGVALSVVEVVTEATRRLDEWQSIHRRIASPQAVLAIVPGAVEGREGITLLPEQWELLALVDGRRTVTDVVELTGKGEFATCRVLGDLVETGLVEAQDPDAGGQTRLAKLIAAREALRALETVETGGIKPHQSAAAPLAPGGSAVRWIEPPTEVRAPKPSGQDRPAVAPRARLAEVPLETAPPERGDHERTEEGEKQAADEPASAPVASAPAASKPAVDRAQVARELASLGLDDDGPSPAHAGGSPSTAQLTRDEDLNKGLLLRLIDGVKGA